MDPPSGSETSPTTSPEHSSKQEDSDPNYTLNYEEPRIWAWGLAKGYTQVAPEYFPLSGVHALKEKQRQVQIARYQLQDF